MSIIVEKKDVKEGRGKEASIIGYVDVPQIVKCLSLKELLADVEELETGHLEIQELITSINNGLAIRYRSPLHRPESKVVKKVNNAVAETIYNLIDDEQSLDVILIAGKKHFTPEELTKMYEERIAKVK